MLLPIDLRCAVAPPTPTAPLQPALLSRRAMLPLPLLFMLPPPLPAAAETEIEARAALSNKMDAASEVGKGIDVDRRGQFNEKALFSEDFYYKFGLRPTAADARAKLALAVENGEVPFAPIQRRYTGYTKYNERIRSGAALYAGGLRDAVLGGSWGEIAQLLEKGSKGRGSNAQGEGTAVAASELRSSCRALGLFGNAVLQSENDSGTTQLNLLLRHLINELYFSMDDMAAAALSADKEAAKAAWRRGRDYLNAALSLVSVPINSRVGDKFVEIEVSI